MLANLPDHEHVLLLDPPWLLGALRPLENVLRQCRKTRTDHGSGPEESSHGDRHVAHHTRWRVGQGPKLPAHQHFRTADGVPGTETEMTSYCKPRVQRLCSICVPRRWRQSVSTEIKQKIMADNLGSLKKNTRHHLPWLCPLQILCFNCERGRWHTCICIL